MLILEKVLLCRVATTRALHVLVLVVVSNYGMHITTGNVRNFVVAGGVSHSDLMVLVCDPMSHFSQTKRVNGSRL